MHTTLVPATTDPGGGRTGVRQLVTVFAVTQTVGYGVLYYAFSVLLKPIASALHASTAAVTGAATVSILVAAAAAIPVGRWLDRHGGRALMTCASLLGVGAVLAWSRVDALWQLYAVFALIGLASAGCLYEAAFPVIVAVTNPAQRDRALLSVTIVAGFASSIFFPVTGTLLAHLGWRTTLVLLALLLAVTAIPGHLSAVPARRVHHAHAARHTGATVREAMGDVRFWLLGLGFTAQAAATSAVGVLLVVFLQHAGYGATLAAGVSALLGVLSVTGRLVTTGLARRHGMTAVTAAVFAVQATGALLLPHATGALAATAACITAFGLGFGVATIARPAILAHRYGTGRYASVAATMTVPITLAKAGAPLGAAALGGGRFLTAAGLACLLAATCLWISRSRALGRPPTLRVAPIPSAGGDGSFGVRDDFTES